ncbi:MAG: hypothetical protein AAGB22_00610 [Bacteroidota bacterium]
MSRLLSAFFHCAIVVSFVPMPKRLLIHFSGCLLVVVLACLLPRVQAQLQVDSSLAFQGNPAKKYSLYVPSDYMPDRPYPLVVGLHPFNTERWNAASWRDTLQGWAEQHQLLLLCPDGDADGRIDDPIDTAFTRTMLDSMQHWFRVDTTRIFLMGFSWGGRATYAQALQHPHRYAGFIILGAATDTAALAGAYGQAADKPFYIIHGAQDRPDARFYPVRDSLVRQGAYVATRLLPDVGHTIDFPGRNKLLSRAWLWVDSVHQVLVDTVALAAVKAGVMNRIPEVVSGGSTIWVEYMVTAPVEVRCQITDISGKEVAAKTHFLGKGKHRLGIPTGQVPWGLYNLKIQAGTYKRTSKLMIRG